MNLLIKVAMREKCLRLPCSRYKFLPNRSVRTVELVMQQAELLASITSSDGEADD